MDSRQRFKLAMAHKQPDRIPIDYWATSEVNAKLSKHFGLSSQEQLLQHLDVDFRYIEGPQYIGPELKETGFGTDLIFFVFLPPLLFQGAMHMDVNRLLAHLAGEYAKSRVLWPCANGAGARSIVPR